MNATSAIDVPRLIRVATLLLALVAGTLVYFAFAPIASDLQRRIDDAQATLRSDEVAFAEIARVRAERDELAHRYSTLFSQNPEAVFLRELSAAVRAHGVTLVSTAVTRDANVSKAAVATTALLVPTRMQIELRGSYPRVLATIGDLSLGSEIVFVEAPSIRRDANDVVASIPLTVYEPDTQNALPVAAGGRP